MIQRVKEPFHRSQKPDLRHSLKLVKIASMILTADEKSRSL